MKKQFERYPKFEKLYLNAMQKLIDKRKAEGKEELYGTPEAMMRWWTQEDGEIVETEITELLK